MKEGEGKQKIRSEVVDRKKKTKTKNFNQTEKQRERNAENRESLRQKD